MVGAAKARNPLPSHGSLLRGPKRDRSIDLRGNMVSKKLDLIGVEKPWGVASLPPQFEGVAEGRVGEIWFDPPAGDPLLVKYIFTSERLSIQVHPDDSHARARGLSAGKEECWYIVGAEPDAVLGIGTRDVLNEAELAEAARSGEIEALMEWHRVEPGMFFHIPAGTVHAIGAGVSLVEIQQNSDITYRLYDYGRPRELHLVDGAAVAIARPMPGALQQMVDPTKSAQLLSTAGLSVVHVVADDRTPMKRTEGGVMIVPLAGEVTVGGVSAGVGQCLWTDDPLGVEPSGDGRFLAGWKTGRSGRGPIAP